MPQIPMPQVPMPQIPLSQVTLSQVVSSVKDERSSQVISHDKWRVIHDHAVGPSQA